MQVCVCLRTRVGVCAHAFVCVLSTCIGIIALREDKREWSNKALDAQISVEKLQHEYGALQRKSTSNSSSLKSSLEKERTKMKEYVRGVCAHVHGATCIIATFVQLG